MIYQLLYISTVTRPMLRIDIETILFTSRRLNKVNEITGMLISSPNRFMQLLEGDEAVVRGTYERIAKDDRHYASVILRETHIAERQFADWTMASHFLPDMYFGTMADQVQEAVGHCDVITMSYLMGFAQEQLAA
jgi:hypothetical protein